MAASAMRSRSRVTIAVLAALFVGVPASPAAAAFGPKFDLAPQGSGSESDWGEVAVDADGDAVFVFSRWFPDTGWRIQTRTHTAGVLSEGRTLSAGGKRAEAPDVAVDPEGNAVFVWRRFDGANWRVQARALSATGVLSPVQTLSQRGEDVQGDQEPQVAVDADGDAVFAWSRFDGANWRVQARALSAAGILSPVQTLSDTGQDALDTRVAVDGDGDAVFSWRFGQLVQPSVDRAQARARSAAGVLSPVQTLSDPGDDIGGSLDDPELGVDADGDAVFTWTRCCPGRVQARARSAAGTLGPVHRVSQAGQGAHQHDIAVTPDGNAVLTWRGEGGVKTRTRDASGVYGTMQTVSDWGVNPEAAVDADGDAVFAWDSAGGPHLAARTRTAAGVLGPIQFLSSDSGQGADEEAWLSGAAAGSDGTAAVVWNFVQTFEDDDMWVQGAVGP
jgi:hypothetical protein